MVSWDSVSKGKELGGLGVRRIREVNVCLLAKWWWSFGVDHNSLWKSVLCSKISCQGGKWKPNFDCHERSSRIWKDITKVSESYPNV